MAEYESQLKKHGNPTSKLPVRVGVGAVTWGANFRFWHVSACRTVRYTQVKGAQNDSKQALFF